MKRIDYLNPNPEFFARVNEVLKTNAYNIPHGFVEKENSVIIRLDHYNAFGYKFIEVDKNDLEKYFSFEIDQETIKI